MTKTFITAIPFQLKGETKEKDGLKKVMYPAMGNSKLGYGETRFPIIPVINGYANEGDKIRVIALLTDDEKKISFHYNYETYFLPEIAALVQKKNYLFDGVEVINTPDREDIETHLQLFSEIIAKINDGEEVYACITYGTKPTPLVETMALNYAYKLKKDVDIGCIVYGRYNHRDKDDPNNGIYDTTALFYMDTIVNRLAEMKVSNPEKAIRAMLGIGDSDG